MFVLISPLLSWSQLNQETLLLHLSICLSACLSVCLSLSLFVSIFPDVFLFCLWSHTFLLGEQNLKSLPTVTVTSSPDSRSTDILTFTDRSGDFTFSRCVMRTSDNHSPSYEYVFWHKHCSHFSGGLRVNMDDDKYTKKLCCHANNLAHWLWEYVYFVCVCVCLFRATCTKWFFFFAVTVFYII